MTKQESSLDLVFRALADPTRRAVLERLGAGPASVSALAEPFAMALPTFTQHLKVLEACGLVRSSKAGRVRTCEIAPQPIERAEHWLAAQRSLWQTRLDQLDRYVTHLHETHEKERAHGKRRKTR